MISGMPLASGYVLLRKVKETDEVKTKGGIILPEGVQQEDNNVAIYVNHNLLEGSKDTPIEGAESNKTKVVFNSYKSIFVNIDEDEFIYVKIKHILGVINEIPNVE